MGDLVAQLDIDPARKANAELWVSELNELSSSGKCGREKIDSQINGVYFEDTGDLISKTSSDSFITNSPLTSPDDPNKFTISPLSNNNSPHKTSHANNFPSIMNNKSDIFRVSISSSAPSTSSQDEFDTFNEIYIWGENNINNFTNIKGQTEILAPTALQTELSFLDTQEISCGNSHLAVLSKNGEIFTWGEKFINSLTESNRPRIVESITGHSDPFERISCGEYHTCAVTNSGELYTWGTETGHWMPKRVTGTMDLTIRTVSCGTWHTAFITTNGQLYAFGDGTFGALGHGNRCNISCPKLVECLNGLKVIDVSCGAWHTAGIVQVSSSQTSQMGQTGGKLFTWGDGDKNRLGHGDREPRLKPTCVNSLIDHNFIQVSCGQSLTVCLSSQGEVFTFGSSVYGQLGNPDSDGSFPVSVLNPNFNESVREISCGFYHVAVLTNKNEVFTWGKGQKGQLGHGDSEDRKVPAIVESLRDKTVKSVSCGASFTVAVILSKNSKKVVGGNSEQIQCSNCRQNFGFTRKKHVCYNCGSVLCNNCTSKKSFRANLAPNPNKPYRVCDSCYIQLNNNIHNNSNSNISNYSNNGSNHNEKKRNVNFPLVQIKDVALNNGNLKKVSNNNKKGGTGSFGFRTRPVSPFSRRPSPPRSATPGGPTTRGFSLSRIPLQPDGFSLSTILPDDGLRKANELLNEEIKKLRSQVGGLKEKCESQEIELKKLEKQAQEASQLASEESSKSKAAKEVIKTLTSQLKEMADKMPQDRTPLLVPNNTNGTPLNNEEENPRNSNDTNNNNKKVQSLINSNDLVDKEWIEQYEPGVYITLMTFHDGTRDLKRVRFSRRRFGENQAESWWNENREKVYEKYNVRGGSDRISSASSVRSSRA